MNRLTASVASIVTAGVIVAGAAEHAGAAEAAPLAHRQYPACAQEDDTACIWHNQGPGYSFVAGVIHDGPGDWRVSDRLANKLQNREGTWRKAADTHWLGRQIDDTHRGTFTVRRGDVVSTAGGTTFVIRKSGRVGTT